MMTMIISFLPFFLFSCLFHQVAVLPALSAAAILALGLSLWFRYTTGSARLIELTGAALFGAMALYSVAGGKPLSFYAVRMILDTGLGLMAAITVVIGKPFTLQYARQSVAPEFWSSPRFMAINNKITWIWALAFLLLGLTDLFMLLVPGAPHLFSTLAAIAIVTAAIKLNLRFQRQKS